MWKFGSTFKKIYKRIILCYHFSSRTIYGTKEIFKETLKLKEL